MGIDGLKMKVRQACEERAIEEAYASTCTTFERGAFSFADWITTLDRELEKSLTFYCEAR